MVKAIINPDIKKTFPWKLAVIFLLFSGIIILMGIYYYRYEKKRIFEEQEKSLSAISSLKIKQISQWYSDKLADAVVIKDNEPLVSRIKQYLKDENQTVIKKEIAIWLEALNTQYDYSSVALLDTLLKVKIATSNADPLADDNITTELKNVLRDHKILMIDLHKTGTSQTIRMDLLVPLLDPLGKEQKTIGLVILCIDPDKILFPLVQSWPTPSKSSETLILRKEKDSVLYLNELRHIKNSALNIKFPLSKVNLLAVKAVNGFEGVTEGTDYRNIPVIGAISKIPGMPWYMVAKTDKEEILTPFKRDSIIIVFVIILLILINASIFGFWIWQQRIKFYKNQLKSDLSIRELEERFTTAFRMSPVSVTISSISDNKFLDVNNAFLEDMEYKKEEVIGRTAKELNIWADENEREWIINELGEKGKVFGKVITYRSKTGKILYGLSSMSVVNVNGEPCNLSTTVNITETRKAEEALQEMRELFHVAIDQSHAGIAIADAPDGKLRYVNDAGLLIRGGARQSIIDEIGIDQYVSSWHLFDLNGNPLKSDEVPLARAVMFGEVCSREFIIRRTEGDDRIVIANAAPVRNVNRQVVAGIAVFMDITESKQNEEALRESELIFRQTFDLSPIGIVMVGLDKKFLRCNDSFLQSLGFKMKELAGKTIADVTHPEDISIGMNDMAAIARGEIETSHVQKRYLRKDGEIIWGDVLISLIRNNSGEPEYFLAIIQDITESKKIVEALRESEERFRSLYENVTIGIYRTTADGKILLANPALVNMLGFDSFEQLTNRNLEHEGYEPEYPRSKFLETMEKEGKVIGLESAWKKQNGDVLFVRESAKAARDAWGKMLYYDGTVEDITDRKKVEEALLESEDKFKYIFDHSVIAKSITLPSGEINVNRAFCDMLGYQPEDLKKINWADISHPDDNKLTNDSLNLILSGKKDSVRFTKRYIHKNGSVIWADVGTSLRRDTNNNPQYFMTTANDITERKAAEDELRIQSEIMSHMAEAVYLVRMEDGIIVFANSRFEELFGYAPGEMTGKPVSIVNAPTDRSPVETATEIISELENNGFWTGEVLNIKKDRTVFWSHANVAIFNHSKFGKVLVSVQQDITERKYAESQIKKLNEDLEHRVIQRTELLEAANKELESFSYSVSHDLRAPLRAVHGYTKILQEDYSGILGDEGNRICSIISSSATQMGELIDDLLSFSRIGRSDISPSVIDMKKMAGVIYTGMTSPAERERIKLKVGKLQKAYGDVKLMGQVWTNLISNAIKYTSKNVTAEILIGSSVSDRMVTYFIKDNGVGFDMQYAHKLFGVFQRLHSESEFEGNGVGLAIVQRIILRHGGKVWAEGEVGKGATFYFSLPVNGEDKVKL